MTKAKGWSTKFPKKEGWYWFYGYRYGKLSPFEPCEPEICFVNVRRFGDGNWSYVADGQFLYAKDVEEAHFKKVDFPQFPKLKEHLVECQMCKTAFSVKDMHKNNAAWIGPCCWKEEDMVRFR